jgi:hypothetical protein
LGSSVLLTPRLQLMLIAAAAWGILLFFLVQRPQWGCLLLALYVPVEEFVERWLPRGPLYEGARFGGELMLFLLLLLVVANNALRGRDWRITSLDVPLLIFLLVAIASSVLNRTPPTIAVLGIRPLLRYVSVYYIMSQVTLKRDGYEKYVTWSFRVALFVCLVGLLQALVGAPLTRLLLAGDVVVGSQWVRAGVRHYVSDRTFIFSTMGRYDTLGAYLVIFLLVGIGLHAVARGAWTTRVRTLGLLGVPALLLSFSRQSWLAVSVGFVAILLMAGRSSFRKTKVLVLIALVAVTILYPTLVRHATYIGGSATAESSLAERALEPFSKKYFEVSRYSYGRLFVIVEVGGRLLERAPFLGMGPGQFGSLTSRFLGADSAQLVGLPENAARLINDVNWVVILGQFGLSGVLAYLCMLFALFRISHSRYRAASHSFDRGLALGYAGAVVATGLLGFFGPNFEVRQISFFLWYFGGIIAGLGHLDAAVAASARPRSQSSAP